ncbi:MAG: hypothetical protein ACR2OC_10205, partial [Solirubrobacterales bacterium]
EAERRSAKLIAEAEAKAARTVELAELQARERVERARKALEDLGVALGSDDYGRVSGTEDVEPAAVETEPVVAVEEAESRQAAEDGEALEVKAEIAEGAAKVEPDPEPLEEEEAPAPETSPSTEDLIAQLRSGVGEAVADTGGDAAARLVAMNMALDGASRDEVDRHIAEGFEVSNREALIDEVFERVGS